MWVDSDHAGDKTTRRSRTGYLIFMNTALIDWLSKKQATIESSVFGSEFIAMKTGVEALIGIRYKLRMMGVPLTGPTYIWRQHVGNLQYITTWIDSEEEKQIHLLSCRTRSSSEWRMFDNILQDRRKLFWHDDKSSIWTKEARQCSSHPIWYLGPWRWTWDEKRWIVLHEPMTWQRPQRNLFACILY